MEQVARVGNAVAVNVLALFAGAVAAIFIIGNNGFDVVTIGSSGLAGFAISFIVWFLYNHIGNSTGWWHEVEMERFYAYRLFDILTWW